MSLDYKKAGVDVEAGDALVDWLAEESQRPQPHQNRILEGIGGFASLFRIGFPEMKKPCLITCTDGVGTKVKIASHFEDYKTIGQDLVAMCVNDLVCTGGDPLLFLDYYATGKLHLPWARDFLASVRKACADSNCALVGGETAEMPGVYQQNDFDCAGFAVGIVDEEKTWGAHKVRHGDLLIGVSSSGFHSNGYSLLRKVFDGEWDKHRSWLMEPTALYVKLCQALKAKFEIHAAAHITGGGVDNIPRVLPAGAKFTLQRWPWPECFQEVQKRTQMSDEKMIQTLNCGLGFVFVVPASVADGVTVEIEKHGFQSFKLGEVSL